MDQLARRPWIVTLLVAAWSIVCHGYRYGVVNHGMQVPLMRMVAGDTCFDHDAFMQTVSRTYTTIFFDGVGLIARFVPLEIVCFVLFVVFRIASVALCIRLGRALFSDFWAGVATAVLVSSQTLTFAEDMVSDVYLNHDALAQALTLAVLVCAVEKRLVLAFFLAGLITPIQSLHAAHLVPLLALVHLGRVPFRRLVVAGLAACVGAVPTLAWMKSVGVMGATYPPGWVEFARAWFPTHYWPLAWSLYDWTLVVTPLAIAPAVWKLAGTTTARGFFHDDAGSLKRLFVVAVVVGLGLGFVCEVAPIPFLIRLHPMRASWIAWLALVPFIGRAAVELVRRTVTFDRTVGVVMLLACVLSVFGRVQHFLVVAPVIYACTFDRRRGTATLATVALSIALPAAIIASKSLAIVSMPFWVGALKLDALLTAAGALSIAIAWLWSSLPANLVVVSGAITATLVTLGHIGVNVVSEKRGPGADYFDVQRWLKENRAPGETVLVPLAKIGVRALSCQTPALDFEDGLASYHDPSYIPVLEKKLAAYGWKPGEAVHGFSFLNHLTELDASLTADDLKRIGRELDAKVAVRELHDGDDGLPVLYRNSSFVVVDIE